MSDQYVGEIRLFPYIRGAPSGWLACDGSLQNVSQYQMLAALLGTIYGGDGANQFGLPDLRGRVPVATGPGLQLGAGVGTETVTLTTQQMPTHNHMIEASTTPGTATDPTGMVYATAPLGTDLYSVPTTTPSLGMAATMVGSAGQNLPHENCAPTLPLVACIAWEGVWPPNPN